MIELRIEEDCKECGEKNTVQATVRIKEEHKRKTEQEFQKGELTAYWHHPGFEHDNCIRIDCKECGAQHILDVGSFEMHCHPQTKGAFTGSWVREGLGKLITE